MSSTPCQSTGHLPNGPACPIWTTSGNIQVQQINAKEQGSGPTIWCESSGLILEAPMLEGDVNDCLCQILPKVEVVLRL